MLQVEAGFLLRAQAVADPMQSWRPGQNLAERFLILVHRPRFLWLWVFS